MKYICQFLACVTVLGGLALWLNTPVNQVGWYKIAGGLVGGALWYALATIIANQEEILSRLPGRCTPPEKK